MRLKDSHSARIGIGKVLTATYPRITDDQLDELIRLLGPQEADSVVDAIDRYVLSPDGEFPPKAGQLLECIRQVEAERKRQAEPPPIPRGKRIKVAIPDSMKAFLKPDAEIYVWANEGACPECQDTGMARFFYDRERKDRAYLGSEFTGLPEAIQGRLTAGMAVCDCQAGRDRKERHLIATRWIKGKERRISTYPMFETIRTLAFKRQEAAANYGIDA